MNRNPKIKNILKYISFSLAASLLPILGLELFLRIFLGYPKSIFNNIAGGLYPKNETIQMKWGFIPYTIVTNQIGLRGPDFPLNKPKHTIRIVAVGDSVTAGFFVDNDATYPHFLERMLNEKIGGDNRHVELINAARGKASIDFEILMIKEYAVPLKADYVLLTFVDNDIAEIRNKNSFDLVLLQMNEIRKTTVGQWLFTRTAIGELAFDLYLKYQSKKYRGYERFGGPAGGDERYNIKGGDDFARNVEINKQFMRIDGTVFEEPYPPETLETIDNYLLALKYARDICNRNGIRLIYAYNPSYIQIYDTASSMKMRDILKKACEEDGIPFIDLTDIFRLKGKNKAIHLAPIDFHPNPEGNKVIAEGIADFLIKGKYLDIE